MDPTSSKVSNSGEEEEWDADGFEIPSLNTRKSSRKEQLQAEKASRAAFEKVRTNPENIYLGPHGAPPAKAHDAAAASSPASRKQRLKQKMKDADKKGAFLGRENKVDVLQDLMGTGKNSSASSYLTRDASEGEWLEPYCHETQFERPQSRAT